MKLTNKQQRFVEEYLIDHNATQSAIRAGYSVKTAKSIGQENLTKPDIADAIDLGMNKLAVKASISAEDVLGDFLRIRDKAEQENQLSVALKSAELMGKHIGMFVDKVESTVTVTDPIDKPPNETRDEWIARKERERKELH